MKILHVCLASHYTVGMTYQDNQLSDQHAADGHEVVVISDCYRFAGHILEEVEEEDIFLSSGVRLIRMKYDLILNKFISTKVRKVAALKKFLYDFRPDIILFHGVAGWEMLTVSDYKRNHSEVKLYIDSHEDFHNSGTFWLSLFFQYRIFNKFIVNRVRKNVDKFLYLSYESKAFCQEVYGLRDDEMEFYPLGGDIVEPDVKVKLKDEVKVKLGLDKNDVLIVHTGKFAKEKKTQELLESFISINNEKLKLILIGSIPPEMQPVLYPLIESDHRVHFLGWMNSKELVKYLCAADLYVQPGTQSATMQNAICCGAPVALYPYESHVPYVVDNGFFIKNKSDYMCVFSGLAEGKFNLGAMSAASYVIAYNLLDYKKLAERLCC
ncbi:TPA: glycosyltransferase family 4 protein [Aeromonas hydrophila subsp. hydrophila]|uniref:glycosyltransferase family 4 protein n=1 Tax=Aeromonas hydrophila TaxID=644 RepID=UPI00214DFDAC|nr:glycosyltransferase family 4 protein [Aeromonas hydrophila]HEB5046602.1 glycosyltransferase family 4 protein [Aeromonas hydrophila subsp. hydrophila]HEB5047695.1 glycosyltransferase family 4 protein [Aeromonas hydrophila subsp. hydrophila]